MHSRLLITFLALFFVSPALADETSPPGATTIDSSGNMEFLVKGDTTLRLAPQDAMCGSSSEGAIRFNKSTKIFEGCDGKGVWKNLSGGGESACKFGGTYAAWNSGVAGRSGCLSNNAVTGNCSCPAGYTVKTTGYSFSYVPWDVAFFLCESCP